MCWGVGTYIARKTLDGWRQKPSYAPAFVELVLTRRECEAGEGITVVYHWLQSPVHMDATAVRFNTVCTPEETKLIPGTYGSYWLDDFSQHILGELD